MEKLKTLLGVECVVSTAGSRLNGALLRAGLVDEISLVFLPAVIGGDSTPTLFRSPDLGPDGWPTLLKLLSVKSEDKGRVYLHYQVLQEEEDEKHPGSKRDRCFGQYTPD